MCWGDQAKAYVVVAIVRGVVVAIGCPFVGRIIVPASAPINTVRARPDHTLCRSITDRRKPVAWAALVNEIMDVTFLASCPSVMKPAVVSRSN